MTYCRVGEPDSAIRPFQLLDYSCEFEVRGLIVGKHGLRSYLEERLHQELVILLVGHVAKDLFPAEAGTKGTFSDHMCADDVQNLKAETLLFCAAELFEETGRKDLGAIGSRSHDRRRHRVASVGVDTRCFESGRRSFSFAIVGTTKGAEVRV